MSEQNVIPLRRPPMYQDHQYAATLTATADYLDAFEDVLDVLPDAVLIGSSDTGCAALVFTVIATDPSEAVRAAVGVLRVKGITVPDGASVTVLAHEAVA